MTQGRGYALNRAATLMAFVSALIGAPVLAAEPDGASAGANHEAPALDPQTILILAPQGVAPEHDTQDFNGLVGRVTRAWADHLKPLLEAKGYRVVFVLDQSIGHTPQQKLALHANEERSARAIIATLEFPQIDGDTVMVLRNQMATLQGFVEAGHPGVVPQSVTVKSYVLRSKAGDNPQSITALAQDYVDSQNLPVSP